MRCSLCNLNRFATTESKMWFIEINEMSLSGSSESVVVPILTKISSASFLQYTKQFQAKQIPLGQKRKITVQSQTSFNQKKNCIKFFINETLLHKKHIFIMGLIIYEKYGNLFIFRFFKQSIHISIDIHHKNRGK